MTYEQALSNQSRILDEIIEIIEKALREVKEVNDEQTD